MGMPSKTKVYLKVNLYKLLQMMTQFFTILHNLTIDYIKGWKIWYTSEVKKMKHFGLPIIVNLSVTAMIKYKNSVV